MKLLTSFLIIGTAIGNAADAGSGPYVSLKNEIGQAVSRGNQWLKSQQKPDGHWDDDGLPAFTALALTSAVRDPALDLKKPLPENLEKGFSWLVAQQKEDGGIYNRGLGVYNTATAVTALVSAGGHAYDPVIVKARKYLIDNQWDIDKKKETDNKNDGGIGYGSHNDRADMSNTYLAIEALALSKKVVEDGQFGKQPDLDWDAAVAFLSRCQNLKATNDQDWASDDPQNKGGFIYGPGESKAKDVTTKEGKVALRSYGSMSYAGLLSFIYAKVSQDDPRVKAVREWLGKNYTVAENPGLGAAGMYYYYQTMAKALSAARVDKLSLEDGKEADWRKDLGEKILAIQQGDGSWKNSDGRFMESNPILVTAYTLLSLEEIYHSIPE